MIFTLLLAITGLTLSSVAIYYSVIGLTAIFAAAFWPIVIMGTTLEVSKLVAASWLKANWAHIPRAMKSYLLTSVFVLMFITSMGIFGFLSKAHIEQTSMSTEQVAQIGTLEEKIARSEAKINRWQGEVDRLMKGEDVRVDSLIANEQEGLDKIYARIKDEKATLQEAADKKIALQQERITQAQDRRDKAIEAAEEKFKSSFGGGAKYEAAVEEAKKQELSVASAAQKEILAVNTQLDADVKSVEGKYSQDIAAIQGRIQDLRNQANSKTQDIDSRINELEGFVSKEQSIIDEAREEKFAFEKQYRQLEAEVGPIKYIAEFIYGETDQSILERAVTWVIITIIFVFDPLAVLMLLAAQMHYSWIKEKQNEQVEPNEEPASSEPESASKDIEVDEPKEEITELAYEADDGPLTDSQIEQIKETVTEAKSKTDPVASMESLNKTIQQQTEEPKKKDTSFVTEGYTEESNRRAVEFEEKEKSIHWQEAKKKWKEEHPDLTIKEFKKLYIEGEIDHLPWEDFVTSEKEIEKHTYIMKQHDHQIRKETDPEKISDNGQ